MFAGSRCPSISVSRVKLRGDDWAMDSLCSSQTNRHDGTTYVSFSNLFIITKVKKYFYTP